MKVFTAIAALVAGAVSAILGIVVYPGPLDLPVVGLVLAAAIVGSGAWAMWEWRTISTWVPYTIAVLITTIFFMYFPPSDDALAAGEPIYSNIWVVLAALAAVVPGILAMRADNKRNIQRKTRDDVVDLTSHQ